MTASHTDVPRFIDALYPPSKWWMVILFGALAVLALPPFGAIPILIPCFCALAARIRLATTKRSAFFIGWLFGLGYFTAGLYWIANALLLDVAQFWWLVPFAVVGLPAVLSLWWGLAGLLTHTLVKRNIPITLAFPIAFGLMEYLRSLGMFGFPWNLPGYAWFPVLPMMQSVSIIGIFGLTLLTLWWAVLPLLGWKKAWKGYLLGVVLIGFGLARLSYVDSREIHKIGHTVRIVQPNIAQSLKWDSSAAQNNFETLLKLTAEPGIEGAIKAVIWPESASPWRLEEDATARKAIADVLPENSILLTGNNRLRYDSNGKPNILRNSLLMLNDQGKILKYYDKRHLVPFGEYIPFRQYLPVEKIVPGAIDFSSGEGSTLLTPLFFHRIRPLICYEAIFPQEIGTERADLLLNITNDGWYGDTIGPQQHLVMSVTRAIEQGLPMIRAANTGVSAVVDPYGRITGRMEYNTQGILDAVVPENIEPPLYSTYGNMVFYVLWITFLGAGILIARKRGTVLAASS